MCIAIPALRVIRTRCPNANITLLTNFPIALKAAPAVALFSGTGLIDDYLSYPVGTRNPLVLARLLYGLRTRRYDVVVNLTGWRGGHIMRRDAIYFRCSGIRRRFGFDVTEESDLPQEPDGEVKHEASRLLRRVAIFGHIDPHQRESRDLNLVAADFEQPRSWLREAEMPDRFIAVSIGTKVSANDWGQANWLHLTAELGRRNPALGLVAVGSADERERAAECLKKWPGTTLNLCGSASPRESAAVLSKATVFIGHDSGPMHLSAAVGTPCVAIFAARNPPGQWFPLGAGHSVLYHKTDCFGCRLDSCVKEAKRCILSISVEEVLTKVVKYSEHPGKDPSILR
jgi:ADP-heptose:LPS heptosyltransferase